MNDIQTIQNKIHEIRGQQVMLDFDLAAMYGVKTGRLNEQVKRNIEHFPEDFMFQLTKGEFEILKSQIATSSWGGSTLKTSCVTRMTSTKPLVPSLMPSAQPYQNCNPKSHANASAVP
jgi:hypothetical protein